jgi:hypothetical protein
MSVKGFALNLYEKEIYHKNAVGIFSRGNIAPINQP